MVDARLKIGDMVDARLKIGDMVDARLKIGDVLFDGRALRGQLSDGGLDVE
jgi:hypothetical protein